MTTAPRQFPPVLHTASMPHDWVRDLCNARIWQCTRCDARCYAPAGVIAGCDEIRAVCGSHRGKNRNPGFRVWRAP